MNVVIGLNVGGEIYKTTRDTLTRFPESVLGSKFCAKVPKEKDIEGNFVLDRDGPLFRHILNFLRNKTLALPVDFCEFEQLTLEAKFYPIPGLLEAVRQEERKSGCLRSKIYLTAEYTTNTNTEKCQWQLKSNHIDTLWKIALQFLSDANVVPRIWDDNTDVYQVEMRDMSQKDVFENIWKLGFTLHHVVTSSGEHDVYEFVRRS